MPFKEKYDNDKIREIIEREAIKNMKNGKGTSQGDLKDTIKKELNYKNMSETPIKKALYKDGKETFIEMKIKTSDAYGKLTTRSYITKRWLKTVMRAMLEHETELLLEDKIFCCSNRYMVRKFKVQPEKTLYITYLGLYDEKYEKLISIGLQKKFEDTLRVIEMDSSVILLYSENKEVHRFIKNSRQFQRYNNQKMEKNSTYYLDNHKFLSSVYGFIQSMAQVEFENIFTSIHQ